MVLVWSRPLVLSGCGSDHGSAPAPAAPVLVLVLVWSWPGPRLDHLVPSALVMHAGLVPGPPALVLVHGPVPGPAFGPGFGPFLAW